MTFSRIEPHTRKVCCVPQMATRFNLMAPVRPYLAIATQQSSKRGWHRIESDIREGSETQSSGLGAGGPSAILDRKRVTHCIAGYVPAPKVCPSPERLDAIVARTWFSLLFAPLLHGSGTLADLDGDLRADFAFYSPKGVVNGAYRYRVDVHLTTGLGTTFDVDSASPGGLHITARDVDGDQDLDLVITSQFGHEPVGVWINDGHGQFTHGQADAYSQGIWQETDRCLETPNTPPRLAQPLVNPAGGWVLQQRHLTALLVSQRLHVAADYRSLNRLNLGNPFRAPPLS